MPKLSVADGNQGVIYRVSPALPIGDRHLTRLPPAPGGSSPGVAGGGGDQQRPRVSPAKKDGRVQDAALSEANAPLMKIVEQTRHKSVDMVRVYSLRFDLFRDHSGAAFL